MAIYNLSGVQLDDAYELHGNSLSIAYNISGDKIFEKGSKDYNHYTITNIGGSVAASNTQGIDVYGNILAVWNGGSGLRLYNLDTLASVATITTSQSIHGNDISFSSEFYAESDPFPLLYVDSTPCFRLFPGDSTWSASLIRKLKTPNVYGMKIADGFNGDTLITIGYSENVYTYTSTNKLIIAKWDMTDLTDNGDGTYTPRRIQTVTRDWLECIQGASYHDGYLWVASGIGNSGNKGYVYALDTETGEIKVSIDTGSTSELEGLAWAHNDTDGWFIVVGQVGIGFRKITFD